MSNYPRHVTAKVEYKDNIQFIKLYFNFYYRTKLGIYEEIVCKKNELHINIEREKTDNNNNRYSVFDSILRGSGNCHAQSAQSCRKCFNIKRARLIFDLSVINSNAAEIILPA